MDLLSQVLGAVRLEGAFYFKVCARAPWVSTGPAMADIGSIMMPRCQHVIPFHIMLEGNAWAWPTDGSSPPAAVQSGDIIIVPQGAQHVLASQEKPAFTPAVDCEPYRDAARRQAPFSLVEIGGGGDEMTFVCGYLGCDDRPFNPILSALPPMLIVKPADRNWDLIQSLIGMAFNEETSHQAGSETILSKLSELMFVQALRHYMNGLDEGADGWLAGLRDPRIGRVLQVIHDRPFEAWTLQRLATECGMSRSVLAERFVKFTGEPPLAYLTRWRMQLAAQLLQNGESVAAVADTIGYRSETAFQRAFKKSVGETPAMWRRRR